MMYHVVVDYRNISFTGVLSKNMGEIPIKLS